MMIVTIVVLMLACVVSIIVAQAYMRESHNAGEVIPPLINTSFLFFSISFLLFIAAGMLVAFFG